MEAGGQVRYGADTRLSVREVMKRALAYFGPEGRCKLPITEQGPFRVVFAGGGGYVIASVHRAPSGSHIELEVWQFDAEARDFLGTLPGPESWLRRALRR